MAHVGKKGGPDRASVASYCEGERLTPRGPLPASPLPGLHGPTSPAHPNLKTTAEGRSTSHPTAFLGPAAAASPTPLTSACR